MRVTLVDLLIICTIVSRAAATTDEPTTFTTMATTTTKFPPTTEVVTTLRTTTVPGLSSGRSTIFGPETNKIFTQIFTATVNTVITTSFTPTLSPTATSSSTTSDTTSTTNISNDTTTIQPSPPTSLNTSPRPTVQSTSTVRVTPTRSITSLSSTLSTTASAPTSTIIDKPGIKQHADSTPIFLGVFIPCGIILLWGLIQFSRKKIRERRTYVQPVNTVTGWQPDVPERLRAFAATKAVPQDIQMVDISPPPPIPARSPDRALGRTPSRPPRPESLTPSLIETMDIMTRTSSLSLPKTYPQGSKSGSTVDPLDSSSQRSPAFGSAYSDMTPATPPVMSPPSILPYNNTSPPTSRAYDGTRSRYYEEAINRNLPFSQLTRPSLRISNDKESQKKPDDERSLTPEPLRIVKRNTSDPGGRNNAIPRPPAGGPASDSGQYEPAAWRTHHRGITPTERGLRGNIERPPQRGYATSEPLAGPSRPRAPIQLEEMSDDGTLDLMHDTEEDEHDPERKKISLDYTLHCLEGGLKIPPPEHWRTSSVYSDEQMHEQPWMRGDNMDGKGKGKGKEREDRRDQGGREGGGWI